MLRKNISRPLYREVVHQAWLMAWHDKRLWLMAALAGILQTGGIYDAVLAAANRLGEQSLALVNGSSLSTWKPFLFSWRSWSSWLTGINFVESLLFAGLLVLAILGISVIAQGALTIGLGGRLQGRPLSVRECLTYGARAFWPIAVLNVITLGLLWLCRFGLNALIATAWVHVSFWIVLGCFLVFILFILAALALTTIHLFALQAIMLQNVGLPDALERAIGTLKKHPIVIIESSIIFLVIGVVIYFLSTVLFTVAVLPIFFLGVAALLLQYPTLFWLAWLLGLLLFLFVMLTAGALTITFQYAAWNRLYRRMGEGGVSAKFHRTMQWFFSWYGR